jgi:hypothetical protein
MKWLLSLIVGTCLYLPTLSYTQVIEHRISDDGYARVPLQFAFPYYGRVFTESYMFSNGVVGFLNPTNGFCCSGFDITQPNHPFSFAIMPLQTDLLNYSGKFLTEGTTEYQRYKWENISEYGRPGNLNTFGVEIKPSGFIGIHYEKVNIDPSRAVTMGMTGDSSVSQYTQYYRGPGFNRVENVSYITQTTGDMCLVDPLSSPACVGYQEAYTALQCSSNPLYSPSCPGFAAAYLTQQCSLDALYDTTCPGYQTAYFNQQCTQNSLYNNRCPGYEQAYLSQQCGLNTLYSTSCPGYEAAYFNQQCSLNPLYNQGCTGYAPAYLAYQCNQNTLYDRSCPGYEQAYFNQQCTQNTLYNNQCPGYEQAYFNQQCGLNALYDTRCSGYAQAYFNQQCSNNSLYDRGCPGYKEAYALANVVPASKPVVSAPVLQVSTTGTISVQTPVVSDPVVNEVITRPVNVSTPVQQNNTQSTTETAKTEPKAEKKAEAKPVARQTRAEVKNEVTQTAPVMVDMPMQTQPLMIVDMMFRNMVKKPIQDNNRSYYALIMGSQKSHEEMVDGQYRK